MKSILPMSPWRIMSDVLDMDWPFGRAWDLVGGSFAGHYPRTNAWEGEQGWVIEAEVPGVDPAKLDVTVEGTQLVLKGTKEQVDGESMVFERRFDLPYPVANENVVAKCRNGVLTITLPRHPASEPRRVMIEAA